jgi:hypothetical protein
MTYRELVESLRGAGIDVASSTYTTAELWRMYPRKSYLLFRRYPALYETAMQIMKQEGGTHE